MILFEITQRIWKRQENVRKTKKTVGWHWDEAKQKQVQEQITIGYAATRAEGLQMLAEYNNNPFDVKASKATFQEVYECWSKGKYPTHLGLQCEGL